MRLLDDVLKLAKLRSNDPKKYLPIAVKMLEDRLKQPDTKRPRKQIVRFAHTLETLLTATNDEPELITAMLKKKSEMKKSFVFPKSSDEALTTEIDLLRILAEQAGEKIDYIPIESLTNENNQLNSTRISITDKYRQTLPILDVALESTAPSSGAAEISSEFYPQTMVSMPTISLVGLTVAELLVLIAGQITSNQEPLKLTNTQIEQ